MANIIFKNVTKVYGNQTYGLIDFDCEIKSGEFITVIGSSGSGKTTFLKLIAGLLKPDCGEMYINDILVNGIAPQKRDVAMMFQEYVLYPNFNVFDNVAAYLKFQKIETDVIFKTVMNALDLFGISELANRRIKELSGGQKQRVALAKLFVRTPGVILLDEPLSNVDEASRVEYRKNILMLKQMLPDTTFVYVTHNLSEALTDASRVLVIEEGRNICFTSPSNLINYPPNLDIAEMLNNQALDIQHMDREAGLNMFNDIYRQTIEEEYRAFSVIKAAKHYLGYDEKGQLIGGAKEILSLPAILKGKELQFETFSITLNDELYSRLLGNSKDIMVSFKLSKIHNDYKPGDIKLPMQVVGDSDFYQLILFGDKKFMIHKNDQRDAENGYFNPNDLIIKDLNENKVLANYIIYPNQTRVETNGRYVRIGKDKLMINKRGTMIIGLSDITGIVNRKELNTLRIKSILSEELINDEYKLIYALVEGFKHYICFYLPKNYVIQYNQKNYIKINLEKIKFM